MRIVVDKNNVIQAILYAAHVDGNIEVGDIPEEVLDSSDVSAWCYTRELGFYDNPNYEPPTPSAPTISIEDRLSATEDAVAELIEIVLGE